MLCKYSSIGSWSGVFPINLYFFLVKLMDPYALRYLDQQKEYTHFIMGEQYV